MTFYQQRIDWNYAGPRTDHNAEVRAYRNVDGVQAVSIANGLYRNADVNGIFELASSAENEPAKVYPSGKRKVNVICAWFGGMPPSRPYIQIDVTNNGKRMATVTLLRNYTGAVIADCDSPPLSDSVGDRIMVPNGGPQDERVRAGSVAS